MCSIRVTFMSGSLNLRRRSITMIVASLTFTLLSLSIALPAEAISATHTVTFVEQANGQDTVMAFQNSNAPTALTLVNSIVPTFSSPGHAFVEWNTSAGGSGANYSDGASYSFSSDITLYAQWTLIPVGHTVTYFENAGVSDAVSGFTTSTSPQDLTRYSDMLPQFSYPGHQFVSWNTSANGSGVTYLDQASYSYSADLSLYAQWTSTSIGSLTFAANGATGTVGSITGVVGDIATIPSASGLLYVGHFFTGWNTSADGSGVEYPVGTLLPLSPSQTLYAQWVADVYVVTYHPNGGSLSILSVNYNLGAPPLTLSNPESVGSTFVGWFTSQTGGTKVGIAGAPFVPSASIDLFAHWTLDEYLVTLVADGGSVTPASLTYTYGDLGLSLPTPTFAGHTFSGWFTSATSTTQVGAGGTVYSPTASVELFAQWSAVAMVVVTFDANGASGSISSLSGEVGSTITLPGQSGMLRAGFALSSWNTQAKGGGTRYAVGQAINLTSSMNLYAQWTGHVPAVLFGAIGVFAKNQSVLTSVLKSQVNRLANAIRAKKYHSISLYGYTATTGLASLNMSLSRARAVAVATYLRSRLSALRVKNVTIKSAGEGAIPGGSSSHYSRVEVFVL